MSLMALLVVLGVVGMRSPTAGASSKAMAQTFAEELRAARARAIKRRTPVAVVLSSGAGSRYFSQDYYTHRHPTAEAA